MRLWIAGNGNAELGEFTAYKINELAGIAEAALDGRERCFAFRWIAAEGDDVFNAAALYFGQIAPQLFDRRANACQMRCNTNAESLFGLLDDVQRLVARGATGPVRASDYVRAEIHQVLEVVPQR